MLESLGNQPDAHSKFTSVDSSKTKRGKLIFAFEPQPSNFLAGTHVEEMFLPLYEISIDALDLKDGIVHAVAPNTFLTRYSRSARVMTIHSSKV